MICNKSKTYRQVDREKPVSLIDFMVERVRSMFLQDVEKSIKCLHSPGRATPTPNWERGFF